MTARKLRILEKKIVIDRGHILTIFIRRLLKMLLAYLRNFDKSGRPLTHNCVYCVVQVCYEMGNVE